MQICEYFFENACYSVTKYYLCKQNNKRSLLGRKQRHQVVRSFPNRYLFSLTNKVTCLFPISCILEIILQCERTRVGGEEKRKRTYFLHNKEVKDKSFIIFILEFVSYFKSKCTSCVAILGVLNINTLRQVSKTYIESRAASCCKSTSNHWRKIKSICITNTVTQF